MPESSRSYSPGEHRATGSASTLSLPAPPRTPGTAGAGDLLDTLAGTLPLRRPADAEEIANTIVYLASDDASFITGAIVPADGGRVAV